MRTLNLHSHPRPGPSKNSTYVKDYKIQTAAKMDDMLTATLGKGYAFFQFLLILL